MTRVVTFGEIMLRLSPPGFERFFQSPVMNATFGGGEANVALSLAQFGCESVYVTRLPTHDIGEAALKALRAEGVRTEHILRGGERLGIYFAETGASQRASQVIYDRAHSAISEINPAELDWPRILSGANWFHTTGITPALGSGPARCVAEALSEAKRLGVTVSLDLNYRRKLWSKSEAQTVMRPLMPLVDLVIANEEDIQSVLGIQASDIDVTSGTLGRTAYEELANRVANEFGVKWVAITLRESTSASENGWSALLRDPQGTIHHSAHYRITLVDRIGAGDSFAAGLIHGLSAKMQTEKALNFAVAASALKHTILGDYNRVSVQEVEKLAAGDASGRVQR